MLVSQHGDDRVGVGGGDPSARTRSRAGRGTSAGGAGARGRPVGTGRGVRAGRPGSDRGLPGHRRVALLRQGNRGSVPYELAIINLVDDPTVAGYVVTGHDTSPRALAEFELRKAQSLLTATLDATADGILVGRLGRPVRQLQPQLRRDVAPTRLARGRQGRRPGGRLRPRAAGRPGRLRGQDRRALQPARGREPRHTSNSSTDGCSSATRRRSGWRPGLDHRPGVELSGT